MNNSVITIENVCKNYGSLRAVDNLDAKIPSKCIYGLLGPNGAGKTTLIRMIMDILSPDSGEIKIFGKRSQVAAREFIGYMPEERGLYRKMTTRGILSYLGAIKGMKARSLNLEVSRWLQLVALEDKANKKVEELSKGMQQKLQFAASVISNPAILILDEPFLGLDPVNLELIKKIIINLRNEGKTLLISTHMMEQAERLCDFILLINDGKMIFDGTLDEVQSRFPVNIVSIEVQGDTEFIYKLPTVANIESAGKRLEITLKEDAEPQDLLRLLVEKVKVIAFEVKKPTLHEIFIKSVSKL